MRLALDQPSSRSLSLWPSLPAGADLWNGHFRAKLEIRGWALGSFLGSDQRRGVGSGDGVQSGLPDNC